jgi:TP901-1 family phage major tail protein
MRGVDILLLVEDEATPGTFIAVGGQRNATLSESAETIDETSKDSNGNYEYDYGLGGWTISYDGVYISNEAGYIALKNAMRQKKKVKVRVQEGATGPIEEGMALVTSRELEAPYDAEATYSGELQGTGALAEPAGA